MSFVSTLSYIIRHPLNRGRSISTLFRFANWQIQSRINEDVTFEWINGSKLVVRRGMTGATGNIYCGLHEYADMSFLLHFLQPGDTFLDVGANIGSYTILASKVCGAYSVAVEPDPDTVKFLKRNICVNNIEELVSVEESAVGSKTGSVAFSIGRDTTNQVVESGELGPKRTVKLSRIDDILRTREPIFMKVDVEGYEAEALAGALRTLSGRKLLAIEIETVDSKVLSLLRANGFQQVSYDPADRCLIPFVERNSNNALFVRNPSLVEERLKNAPTRSYRGIQL